MSYQTISQGFTRSAPQLSEACCTAVSVSDSVEGQLSSVACSIDALRNAVEELRSRLCRVLKDTPKAESLAMGPHGMPQSPIARELLGARTGIDQVRDIVVDILGAVDL